MVNGEYCTLAADLDENLNTFYFLKVGKTGGCLTDRADVQRLKIVWGHSKRAGGLSCVCCESKLKKLARDLFGKTEHGYKPAGRSETFGRFTTAEEANRAAWELLWAVQADERFSGDEFWIHPKAVWPVRLRLDWAA